MIEALILAKMSMMFKSITTLDRAPQHISGLKSWRLGTLLLALCCHSTSSMGQESPQQLPRINLRAGMHQIQAQVAQTPQQRMTGLMYRTAMQPHEGMLFIFEEAGVQCFWMKNTLIPLSIAFLDDAGKIVNLDEMKPQSLDSHCSKKSVRFVLEMNTGWFNKRGLKAGDSIQGEPFSPRSDQNQH